MNHVESLRRSVAPCSSLMLSVIFAGCASAPPRVPAELVDSSVIAPSPYATASEQVPQQPPPQITQQSSAPPRQPWEQGPSRPGLPWAVGQPLMQGFIGYTTFENIATDGSVTVDGDEGDLDHLPLIGGGGQWKLGGDRIDFGLEGMMSFSGSANVAAFAAGGGGAVVAVDVDMLLFDLYGGPFVSLFLGDKIRVYGAAGPLMEWASWDQSGNSLDDNGSGFGVGTYARTGIEFGLPSRILLGFGVRWSDSSIDLGGNLGDLNIDGLQMLFTVSRGL